MKKKFIETLAIIMLFLSLSTFIPTSVHGNEYLIKNSSSAITKGEFANLINRNLSLEDFDDTNILDVPPDYIYAKDLLCAKRNGYMNCDEGGKIYPNSTLSGDEVAKIMNKLLGFSDLSLESNVDSIEALLDLNLADEYTLRKKEISIEDANRLVNSLKIARMFSDSPYALSKKDLKDDFFAYKNRKYLATATINPGKVSTSTFIDAEKNINDIFSKDIEQILKSEDCIKNSNEWKIKELYKMYMDEDERFKSKSKLKLYIEEIKAIKNIDELNAFREKYINYFEFEPFINVNASCDAKVDASKWAIFIMPSSYRLGSIEYYSKDEKNIVIQNAYKDYIGRILKYMGETDNIDKRAKAIYALEESRAKKDFPKEIYDDPNLRYTKYSLEDMLKATENSKSLTVSEDLYNLYKNMNVYCANIDYVKYVDSLYAENNLSTLKDYAIIDIFNTFSKVLGEDVLNLSKDLNKALYGKIEEDKGLMERAQCFVVESMSHAFSNIYADKHVFKNTKKDVIDMVENIRRKYCERINKLSWMSESTKKNAIEKLNCIKAYIAYPEENEKPEEKLFDVIAKSEGGNLIDWTLSKKDSEYRDFINILKKDARKNIWKDVSTFTVNAFYMPAFNAIVVPAGILQKPFYDVNAKKEENLGGIGAIIAHEFSHAFDNSGAKYGKDGTLTNWWTDEDFASFKNMTEDVARKLSDIHFSGSNINGRLCTGEIIADLGGLACALDIASENRNCDLSKVMDTWANVWATRMPKEMASYLLAVDVHAPSKTRVNFVISQMDDFYEIFNIKEGDGMFTPKEKRLIIW